MDYHYIADRDRWADGEVQVFDNYHARRAAAAQARREIIEHGNISSDPQSLYERIATRRDQILAGRSTAGRRQDSAEESAL